MSSLLVMGVDPGVSGAMALYDPIKNLLVEILDMPSFLSKNGKAKTILDPYAMSKWLEPFHKRIVVAIVEDVGAMPGNGVVSMFRFGEAKGIIIGILSAFAIPIQLVKPSLWKLAMGLSHDKSLSRAQASKFAPGHAHLFKRVKDTDKAEAFLLAIYGASILASKTRDFIEKREKLHD